MFENTVITDTAKYALITAAEDRRIPHAVILEGTDEQNRLNVARALAQAVVCSGEHPPCGVCSHCLKAVRNIHPDIKVLSKPEKKAMYAVDDIRNVKTDAYVIPGEAECKVYIFSEAQYLSVGSQNTLLKLIEEPPDKAMFILTCPSVSYLLETVRSRATAFFLGEVPSVTDEDGLQTAYRLLKLLCAGNEAEFMAETASLEKDKNFFISVLSGMQACLRDVVVLKSGAQSVVTDRDVVSKLMTKLSAASAMEMIRRLGILQEESRYNLNHNLAVTRLSSVLFSKG